MSIKKFSVRIISINTSASDWTDNGSRPPTATTSMRPRPGNVNTFSMTTAPASNEPS